MSPCLSVLRANRAPPGSTKRRVKSAFPLAWRELLSMSDWQPNRRPSGNGSTRHTVDDSLRYAVVAQHQVPQGAEYHQERQENGCVRPQGKTRTPRPALALQDRSRTLVSSSSSRIQETCLDSSICQWNKRFYSLHRIARDGGVL